MKNLRGPPNASLYKFRWSEWATRPRVVRVEPFLGDGSSVSGSGSTRIVHGIVTPQSPQNAPSSLNQRKAPHRSHFRGSSESYRHPIDCLGTSGENSRRVGERSGRKKDPLQWNPDPRFDVLNPGQPRSSSSIALA
jgi:hypothetical protein